MSLTLQQYKFYQKLSINLPIFIYLTILSLEQTILHILRNYLNYFLIFKISLIIA